MATKRVAIKYNGSGWELLGIYLLSVILITVTIGIYTPFAVNELCHYITENIKVEIAE